VLPTVELAAHTFNISRGTLTTTRKKYHAVTSTTALSFLMLGWEMASDAERVQWIKANEPEIWKALEHVMDAERNLQPNN
jgi:hypothetical protein